MQNPTHSTANVEFSVVVLTYNREKYIKAQLQSLAALTDTEIIIVDNCSDDDYAQRAAEGLPNVRVLRMKENLGAVGRNHGIADANGKYILTLDDDVWGITQQDLAHAKAKFEADPTAECLCFHVIDEQTANTINWMHHCDKHEFSGREFETYEISEGAAIFRASCFKKVGLYPEKFFISHEGPDLAFRIINAGGKILYFPGITVTHAHAIEGRPGWRRYYYDTRNLIWLAYRNYNIQLLLKRFPLQLAAMLFYSLRDGFLSYYVKAVRDAATGMKYFRGTRTPLSPEAYQRICQMDKNRPPLSYYIKERIFKKEVKL